MRNIYYTYHVVNKMRPVDIYDFNTIKEIVKFTGLSTSSITECLEGEKIKGWTITRTPLPKKEKPVKEASPKTFGVLVYLPNGEIIHPTEENATEGQDLRHLAVDDDGGYWVIEALLVPEEWK